MNYRHSYNLFETSSIESQLEIETQQLEKNKE